jgi:hypothetical protein
LNATAFATIVVRFLGIYFLVSGLRYLSSALQVRSYESAGASFPGSFETFVWQSTLALFILAVSIVLLFHTERVTRFVTRGVADHDDSPDARPSFHAVGLSILGAWVLSFAMPSLISKAVRLVVLGEHSRRPELSTWWGENWTQVVESVVEVGLGLLLFLASSRLVRLWTRVQRTSEED